MTNNNKAMDEKQLVALDFAGTGIRAIAAEVLNDNTIRILSDEHRKVDGIKNGIIGQPSGTAFNVAALLKELQNSAGLTSQIHFLSAAVGGRGMKIIPFTIERKFRKRHEVTPELIDEMAQACEKEYVQPGSTVYDVIPLRYIVDGEEMEKPEGHKVNSIVGEYNLVVGNELIKSQLQKCMERIYNAEIDYMPLAAEASSIVITSPEEREEGCAVINFGDSSTSLAIYRESILQHLMVVPLGGQHITRDIEETGITAESAEKLKCLKGVCMQQLIEKPVNIKISSRTPGDAPVVLTDRFVALIIEARLDETMEPVFAELRNRQKELPHGIVITGGGSRLGKLKEYIEQRTGLYTRHGDHSALLAPDSDPRYKSPEFAQLLGTILLAASYRREEPPHLPPEKEGGGAKKKPGRRKLFGESISQGIFRFFEDDTNLQEPEKSQG